MLIGVLAGLTTGALWGLTFIAPLAVRPFSGWDLTVVRYGIFGLASLLLMISPRFRPGPTTHRQVVTGLLLGGFGYTAYVAFVFFAVDLAGVTIPPLIIGTTPIVMALVTNRSHHRVPWATLAVPLVLILSGVLTVNLAAVYGAPRGDRHDVVLGALCALGSLVTWIIYAVINKRIMDEPHPPETLRWTGLQGIGAALGSLVMLPFTTFRTEGLAPLATPMGTSFLLWCLAMGLGGSWLATLCWVVASRRLPLALAAQLIVGETAFGLLYGFIYESRWPSAAEAIGSALQIGGVIAAVAVFHARRHISPDAPDLLVEAAAASGSGSQ